LTKIVRKTIIRASQKRNETMRLTTKGRYAVTAMVDLAIYAKAGPVCLADISKRQEISLSYLEQLFSKLRRKGLVKSIRGPGGGYQLGLSEHDMSIAVIIDAVDETIDATNCRGEGNCHDGQMCLTHNLWANLSRQIHAFLNDITVGMLIDQAATDGDVEKIQTEVLTLSGYQ